MMTTITMYGEKVLRGWNMNPKGVPVVLNVSNFVCFVLQKNAQNLA